MRPKSIFIPPPTRANLIAPRSGLEHSNFRNSRLVSREHSYGLLPEDARTRSGDKGNIATGAVSDMWRQVFLNVFLGLGDASGRRPRPKPSQSGPKFQVGGSITTCTAHPHALDGAPPVGAARIGSGVVLEGRAAT